VDDNNINNNLDLLSIGEASEYLGISIDTLRRWERRGRINPLRSPGGHRYFSRTDLDNLFGRRYTRDEESLRASKAATLLANDSAHPEQPQAETQDLRSNTTIQPLTRPSVTYDFPFPPPQGRAHSRVSGLPQWRSIREELKSESTINKPFKDIPIPQIAQIKIISESAQITTRDVNKESIAEAQVVVKQQTASILNPVETKDEPVVVTLKDDVEDHSNIQNDIVSKHEPITKGKVAVETTTSFKRTIAAVMFIIGLAILSYTWYVLWQKSQMVLSPIP